MADRRHLKEKHFNHPVLSELGQTRRSVEIDLRRKAYDSSVTNPMPRYGIDRKWPVLWSACKRLLVSDLLLTTLWLVYQKNISMKRPDICSMVVILISDRTGHFILIARSRRLHDILGPLRGCEIETAFAKLASGCHLAARKRPMSYLLSDQTVWV